MATPSDAAHGADAAHSSGGLPQLDFSTFPSQIFWLVVSIVVLYYLMTRIALPRISTVLEERADAIADDLDRAEEFKQKAEEAEKAYEKALADARAEAQRIAEETKAEIQKDVDAAMAKADAEIDARTAESEKRIAEIRANALSAIEEVANDTAAAVVDAVLPGAGDAKAIKAAVSARVN